MNVEIWSDVVCPYCYIGKRKFEQALAQFPHRDKVQIIWKSFQLDPTTFTNPYLSGLEHLLRKYGWSEERERIVTRILTDQAKQVGIDLHLEKTSVVNSFDAHCLSHLAKKYGNQNYVQERLFKAYFTEGKNTGTSKTLNEIGIAAGISEAEIAASFSSGEFKEAVRHDIEQAKIVDVREVPFFMFDRNYAISGAKEPDMLLDGLTKAFAESDFNKIKRSGTNEDFCGPGSS